MAHEPRRSVNVTNLGGHGSTRTGDWTITHFNNEVARHPRPTYRCVGLPRWWHWWSPLQWRRRWRARRTLAGSDDR